LGIQPEELPSPQLNEYCTRFPRLDVDPVPDGPESSTVSPFELVFCGSGGGAAARAPVLKVLGLLYLIARNVVSPTAGRKSRREFEEKTRVSRSHLFAFESHRRRPHGNRTGDRICAVQRRGGLQRHAGSRRHQGHPRDHSEKHFSVNNPIRLGLRMYFRDARGGAPTGAHDVPPTRRMPPLPLELSDQPCKRLLA